MSGINEVGERPISPPIPASEDGAISPANQAAESAAPQTSTSKSAELAAKLGINEKDLNRLKETLAGKDLIKLLSPALQSMTETGKALEVLSELEVITEDELADAASVEKAIQNTNPSQTREALAQIKKTLEEIEIESPAGRQFQKIKSLALALEKAIVITEHAVIDETGRTSALKPQSEELKKLEKALADIQKNPTPVETGGAVTKLMHLLESIGSKGSEFIQEGERLLKALYKSQIEIVKTLESTIKRLLVSPARQDNLETLQQTLDQIDTAAKPTDTPEQAKFKTFISEFRTELERFDGESAESEELKYLLVRKLAVIREELGLENLEKRTTNKSEFEHLKLNLSKEQVNSLRSLEAQIKVLVEIPLENLVTESPSSETPQPRLEPGKELEKLLRDIKSLAKHEALRGESAKPVREALTQLATSIEIVLKEGIEPKEAAKKISLLLKNFAVPLELSIKSENASHFFKFIPTEVLSDSSGNSKANLKLNAEQVRLLKEIQLNIKVLVETPDIKVLIASPGNDQLPLPLTPSSQLDQLLRDLKKLIKEQVFIGAGSDKIDRAIQDLIVSIESTMRETTDPKAADRRVRELLQRFSEPLKALTQNKQLTDFSAPQKLPLDGISEPQVAVLKNVTKLITDILAETGKAQVTKAAEVLEALKSHASFKTLKSALLSLESIIPNPANPNEQIMAEFAQQLLQQIERDMNRSLPALHETLRRSLDLVQAKLLLGNVKEEEKPLTALDTRGLAALENMVAGQELLQRMTPVMKAAGDPVMTIFPFIMQGLLSKFEVTSFPGKPPTVDKDGGKKQKPGEMFERVRVVVPFPDLGEVVVDIAHRKGEVMLSLGFERNDIAEFVKRDLPKLELVLKNSDYERVSFGVTARALNSEAINEPSNSSQDLVIA